MTDLTEMVEWLRREIESDKTAADEAPSGPWRADEEGCCVTNEVEGTFISADVDNGDPRPPIRHVVRHDPRDTIARCEAELAIIDSFAHWDHSGRFADLAAELHWSILGQVVQRLAYGYRHRPGWKESWKA